MAVRAIEHSFNIDIAAEYGVYEAIVLKNLLFWIQKNEANEKHYHDGHYWTYNSAKAFKQLFPYFSEKQIRTILSKLEKAGLILSGNYNQSSYDRTKWYALTDKAYELFGLGSSNLPNGKMENPERENESSQTVTPIPDGKPVGKPSINNNGVERDKTKARKRKEFTPPTFDDCKAWYDDSGYTFDLKYFYDYYTASNWHKKDGSKVNNWKLCMVTFQHNHEKWDIGASHREQATTTESREAVPSAFDW